MNTRTLSTLGPSNYDRWRPHYCDKMFQEILNYVETDEVLNIVEIGPGTGQATEPFLSRGHHVTAIEKDGAMAAFIEEKYRRLSNFEVRREPFEDSRLQDGSVDMVIAGSSLHWIPANIAYPRIWRMLKEGGRLAVFWNRPFAGRRDDPLHQAIQRVYKELMPSEKETREIDVAAYRKISAEMKGYKFKRVFYKIFQETQVYTPQAYINRLETYEDHARLSEGKKLWLYDEIGKTIEAYGGEITVYDTMDLHLGTKQSKNK